MFIMYIKHVKTLDRIGILIINSGMCRFNPFLDCINGAEVAHIYQLSTTPYHILIIIMYVIHRYHSRLQININRFVNNNWWTPSINLTSEVYVSLLFIYRLILLFSSVLCMVLKSRITCMCFRYIAEINHEVTVFLSK